MSDEPTVGRIVPLSGTGCACHQRMMASERVVVPMPEPAITEDQYGVVAFEADGHVTLTREEIGLYRLEVAGAIIYIGQLAVRYTRPR